MGCAGDASKRCCYSSSASNKLWELMVLLGKSFSRLNFDETHWPGTVCGADKANRLAKSSMVLQECVSPKSRSLSRTGLISCSHRERSSGSLCFSASLRKVLGGVPRVIRTPAPCLSFRGAVPTRYRFAPWMLGQGAGEAAPVSLLE